MRSFRVVTGTSGSFLCKDVEESSVWTCCALHTHSSEKIHFLFLPYGALQAGVQRTFLHGLSGAKWYTSWGTGLKVDFLGGKKNVQLNS